jgi:hypothetical protein
MRWNRAGTIALLTSADAATAAAPHRSPQACSRRHLADRLYHLLPSIYPTVSISYTCPCPQEVDLNAPDEPGPLDQLLIEYQEELHGLYKRSPYYIEKPADKAKDFDDKITRYTDK